MQSGEWLLALRCLCRAGNGYRYNEVFFPMRGKAVGIVMCGRNGAWLQVQWWLGKRDMAAGTGLFGQSWHDCRYYNVWVERAWRHLLWCLGRASDCCRYCAVWVERGMTAGPVIFCRKGRGCRYFGVWAYWGMAAGTGIFMQHAAWPQVLWCLGRAGHGCSKCDVWAERVMTAVTVMFERSGALLKAPSWAGNGWRCCDVCDERGMATCTAMFGQRAFGVSRNGWRKSGRGRLFLFGGGGREAGRQAADSETDFQCRQETFGYRVMCSDCFRFDILRRGRAIIPYLFNVYMKSITPMHGHMERKNRDGGSIDCCSADDSALWANSADKMCWLV